MLSFTILLELNHERITAKYPINMQNNLLEPTEEYNDINTLPEFEAELLKDILDTIELSKNILIEKLINLVLT